MKRENHLSIEQIDRLMAVQLGVPDDHAERELLEEARGHLVTCQDCQRLVAVHEDLKQALGRLKDHASKQRTPDCPTEDSLNEVAAGISSSEEAGKTLTHALQCDYCGPFLRQATEVFSSNDEVGERELLSSLQTSTAGWQESFSRRLVELSSTPQLTPRLIPRRRFSGFRPVLRNPWVYGAATVIVLCVASTAFLLWRSRPGYANQLLAQAYSEHRTLDFRIPGAAYAPMRVERGVGTSSLDKSASLLKAEGLISESLRRNPNDTSWLDAKARADLLDGNYESAIRSLQRALELHPDYPPLLTDLGAAYFLRAETADRATDYGNAVESLGRSLAKAPDDPIALFNHALACERMFFYAQAVGDWEHYLRVDPNGDWANDARAHLRRVRQKMAERGQKTSAPLLSPKAFSGIIDTNDEDAIAVLDERSEQYQQLAIQTWLPQIYSERGDSRETMIDSRGAIENLAELLERRHGDTWLVDFLARRPSPSQRDALRNLLSAEAALQSGHYGDSEELARRSVRGFQSSNNQAGALRASFALTLAQSFALKYADCQRTASAMVTSLSGTRYRWLQTQTLLQLGECQDAQAEDEDALQSALTGAETARRSHYPGLELRAIAFEAAYRRDTANADRGLHDLLGGLSIFWRTNATDTRGENLYSVLFDIAGTKNWPRVEQLSLEEKISDFPIKDPVDQAVSWELLAGAQERSGNYVGAQVTLSKATRELSNIPEDSGVILRKGEIALERASIQLQSGDPRGATVTLAGLRREFEAADSGVFKAEYFKTYGEAYLALGDFESAEPLLVRGLTIWEAGLRGLELEADKLQWSRLESQIYRDLLEIKVKSGKSTEAFALWEWYKSASLRSALSKSSRSAADSGRLVPGPPRESNYALPPGMALVSYAVLKNSVAMFVFYRGNVRSHVLEMRDKSDMRVLRFLNLCADRTVDTGSFTAEGRRLYRILVSPVESDIEGATALQFETDGILDRVPFDLLQGDDGHFLGDRFEMSYSPGLAYRSHSKLTSLGPYSPALVVVASASTDSSMAPLPEADEEGRDVSSHFRKATILSGSRATRTNVLVSLRDAAVFHFVGHAVADVDKVGLLLGPDATLNSNDLVKLRPRHLELVVLSACDTANGEEGVFTDVNSLARTLAVVGVPQTIASRWQVDSAVTRQLMRVFYSELMSGRSATASLRAATVAIRLMPEYQQPYYWGSFVVVGNS